MTDGVSRRDLLAQSLPAMALGAGVLAAGNVFGQDQAADGAAGGNGAGGPGANLMNTTVMQMLKELGGQGSYTLPKLPYAYDALEPHIDAQTMQLHHDKHQQGYVNNLNKTIEALSKLRESGDELDSAKLAGLTRDISFNAGGAIFHTFFFGLMTKPDGKGVPDNDLTAALKKQYGSVEKFQAHFSKVAGAVKGSGWAIAFYEPVGDNVLITDTGDQDLRIIPGGIPILLVDVWEHAYYLKYQNKRADYIKAWWNVVNWDEANKLFTSMRRAHNRV